jgi:16S rRNA (uracil1498-N3)-methyltransferase
MPQERYYIDSALQKGELVQLSGSEMQHMMRVMRTRVGDQVELINGKGILAQARLKDADKHAAHLEITSLYEEKQKNNSLILCQGMPRVNKLDFIIEKATELGVTEFRLFPAKRSEKKDLSVNQSERINTLIISAIKQSGRLFIPTVTLIDPIDKWSKPKETLLFGDLDPNAISITQKLKDLKEVIFVTGPESGLTSEEEYTLKSLGGIGVKINSHILRTETASIAAVAILASKE